MAWETWKSSNLRRKLLWIVCSTLWLALCLLAARTLDLTVPYLALAIAGGLIFYLRNLPKVTEQIAWVLLSVGFGLVVRFPHDHNWINAGSSMLALFGMGVFLILGLRWLWSGASERRKTYAVLAPATSLVFLVLSTQHALNLANLLYPKTFDLYLYVVDGSFGFQPSFLIARTMLASSILRIAAQLTYVSLPFVMALVYSAHLRKDAQRPSWDIITLFLLAGLGGWALYNVVPATGPGYFCKLDFPWRALPYQSLQRLFLEQIPVSTDVPRNAMPSLHMAWVVLIYWAARRLSRALQVFVAGYLALTVLSTMGTGEHYFVDLVVAVPFALFVQAVVCPDHKTVFTRRAVAALSGLALTLAWLILIRFAAKAMLVSPILPWALVAATGIAVSKIKSWFDAQTITTVESQTTPAKVLAAAACVGMQRLAGLDELQAMDEKRALHQQPMTIPKAGSPLEFAVRGRASKIRRGECVTGDEVILESGAPALGMVVIHEDVRLPSANTRPSRLACVDLLRGVVMVLMALDHTRGFFSGLPFAPEDLAHTSGPLFFTRFVTHFCAPVFFLLAGTGGYLSLSQGKSVAQVSRFFWTRGLWLVFLDLTIIAYAWTSLFPFWFSDVLWSLGWSMIAMALIVRLPLPLIAAFGTTMVFTHNLLDRVNPAVFGRFAGLWLILHGHGGFWIEPGKSLFFVLFALIPWVGVMAIGYALGAILFAGNWRKQIFCMGFVLTIAFLFLRIFHLYGNSQSILHPWAADAAGPWRVQATLTLTVVSFFDTLKYPPSLQFLLMTLGPALMALVWFDRVNAERGLAKVLVVFGRVPLFYYVLQLYAIRTLAVWVGLMCGQKVAWMLYGGFFLHSPPAGYGHGLPFIYAMWLTVVLLLYPPCKWFMNLKQQHADWWWLRYL
jgi:uncharacterized membrane protein